jgi:hypothetical protein
MNSGKSVVMWHHSYIYIYIYIYIEREREREREILVSFEMETTCKMSIKFKILEKTLLITLIFYYFC